jgi:aryl-alcohol dehydrogenase
VRLDVPAMLDRGPRVVGINQGGSVPRRFLPVLAELCRSGRLPVAAITRSFPFPAVEEAARAALSGAVVKPVLEMP